MRPGSCVWLADSTLLPDDEAGNGMTVLVIILRDVGVELFVGSLGTTELARTIGSAKYIRPSQLLDLQEAVDVVAW